MKEKLPKIGKKSVKSKFEYNSYLKVKGLLPKGATVGYEEEKIPYYIQKEYTPDLLVEFKDGRKIYIEYKGYFSFTDRQKMVAVKDSNPDLDIRLVFQRDDEKCLGKRSKTKPSEWAVKYEFEFAIGEAPSSWFS